VKGVPGPDPDKITPEEKAMSLKWWAGTLAKAKKIQAGDAITIGYQREKMTITSVYVTHIVGSGSLSIEALRRKTPRHRFSPARLRSSIHRQTVVPDETPIHRSSPLAFRPANRLPFNPATTKLPVIGTRLGRCAWTRSPNRVTKSRH
jgi:hypothetical protein